MLASIFSSFFFFNKNQKLLNERQSHCVTFKQTLLFLRNLFYSNIAIYKATKTAPNIFNAHFQTTAFSYHDI